MPALAAAWFSMSWMRVLIFGKRQKQKNLSMLRLRQTMIELGTLNPPSTFCFLETLSAALPPRFPALSRAAPLEPVRPKPSHAPHCRHC